MNASFEYNASYNLYTLIVHNDFQYFAACSLLNKYGAIYREVDLDDKHSFVIYELSHKLRDKLLAAQARIG